MAKKKKRTIVEIRHAAKHQRTPMEKVRLSRATGRPAPIKALRKLSGHQRTPGEKARVHRASGKPAPIGVVKKLSGPQRTTREQTRFAKARKSGKIRSRSLYGVSTNKGGGRKRGQGLLFRRNAAGQYESLGRNQIIVQGRLFNRKHLGGLRSLLEGKSLSDYFDAHAKQLDRIGLTQRQVERVDRALTSAEKRRLNIRRARNRKYS